MEGIASHIDQQMDRIESLFHQPKLQKANQPPPIKEQIQHGICSGIYGLLPGSEILSGVDLGTLTSFFVFLAIVMVAFLIGLFVHAFIENRGVTYISLDKAAGECVDVPKPLSGTFLISASGLWEGFNGFLYNEAIASVDFHGLEVDSVGFENLLLEQMNLTEAANYISSHNIVDNLVFWMSYRKQVVTSDEVQSLTLLGQPNVVYNRANKATSVHNGLNASLCHADSVTFDRFSATYGATFSPTDTLCVSLMSSFLDFSRSEGSVTMNVNMNTFTSALAVNMRILKESYLEPSTIFASFSFQGDTFDAFNMYDRKYEQMEPIMCVHYTGTVGLGPTWAPYCFVAASETLFIPTMHHFNDSCTQTCEDTVLNPDLHNAACNAFDLEANLLNNPVSRGEKMGELLSLLEIVAAAKTQSNLTDLVMVGDSDYVSEMLNGDTENNTAIFDICANCTLFTIKTWGTVPVFTPHGNRLDTGHCNDTHVSESNFALLAAEPPLDLVEEYF